MAYIAKFKPVSNQGDWATWIYMFDRDAGTPIDMTGISSSLVAELLGHGARLTGSDATGEITYPSPGFLQVFFPVTRMQSMRPGSYRVGLTMSNGARTTQMILGMLPIVDGVMGTGCWQGYYS